jgi:hypothetical protein
MGWDDALGPKCYFVRCKDMSEVEVKADLKRDAEFGRDASGIGQILLRGIFGWYCEKQPRSWRWLD